MNTQGSLSPTGGVQIKRIRTWKTRLRLFREFFKRTRPVRLNLNVGTKDGRDVSDTVNSTRKDK
jgi:hypothetical protein